MKKLKLTDEVKTGLSAFLKVTYPNETTETLEFVLSEFLWDSKENEWEFYDIEELQDELRDYAARKIQVQPKPPPHTLKA